jgi:hypothetical protein
MSDTTELEAKVVPETNAELVDLLVVECLLEENPTTLAATNIISTAPANNQNLLLIT